MPSRNRLNSTDSGFSPPRLATRQPTKSRQRQGTDQQQVIKRDGKGAEGKSQH